VRRRRSRRDIAGRVAAAGLFAVVLSGQTYFKQFTEVEPVCTGATPRYGKEVQSGYSRDRLFEFAAGQPEYDRTVALLPRAVSGWVADAPKVTAMASHIVGCTLSAGRMFRRNGDTMIVSLMLGPMVDFLKSTIPKQEHRSGATAFQYKGYTGILIEEKSNRSLMIFAGKIVLMISGPATEAEMRGLLDRVDLDSIAILSP